MEGIIDQLDVDPLCAVVAVELGMHEQLTKAVGARPQNLQRKCPLELLAPNPQSCARQRCRSRREIPGLPHTALLTTVALLCTVPGPMPHNGIERIRPWRPR